MTEKNIVTFRASPVVEKELGVREERGRTRSHIADRDLERYYYLLHQVCPTFSLGEAGLLVDVFNGTLWEPYSMPLLWHSISDAIHEGYVEKWQETDPELNGAALVEKLRKLTLPECMAVADAIERYWTGNYHKEGPILEDLQRVGLVK